jgi:hypothetical protein
VSRTHLVAPGDLDAFKERARGGSDTWRAMPVVQAPQAAPFNPMQTVSEVAPPRPLAPEPAPEASRAVAWRSPAASEVPAAKSAAPPPPAAPAIAATRASESTAAPARASENTAPSRAPKPPPTPASALSSAPSAPRSSAPQSARSSAPRAPGSPAPTARVPAPLHELVSRPPPPPPPAEDLPASNTKWVISAVLVAVALVVAAFAYRSISGKGTTTHAPGPSPDDPTTGQEALAPLPEGAQVPPGEEQQPPVDLDLTAQGSNDAAMLIAEGKALEQEGKRAQAMAFYDRALSITPNDAALLSRMAFNHLNRGDNKSAEDFAGRAAAVDPTSSEAWIVLGAARDGLGNRAGAREAYKRCVELARGQYVEECRRMVR